MVDTEGCGLAASVGREEDELGDVIGLFGREEELGGKPVTGSEEEELGGVIGLE